jgi:hypothetical protein
MGLFGRKTKEYVYSPETGCAVCKQSLANEWYYVVRFIDGHTARNEVVLEYRLHLGQACFDKDFIKRSQPAGTQLILQKQINTDAILKANEKRLAHLRSQG